MNVLRVPPVGLAGVVLAALSALAASPAHQPKKGLLFIGESRGWQHDSISYAAATLWNLGHDTGLWVSGHQKPQIS